MKTMSIEESSLSVVDAWVEAVIKLRRLVIILAVCTASLYYEHIPQVLFLSP